MKRTAYHFSPNRRVKWTYMSNDVAMGIRTGTVLNATNFNYFFTYISLKWNDMNNKSCRQLIRINEKRTLLAAHSTAVERKIFL